MKRVCAWCNKSMQPVKGRKEDEELVTHSICSDCADNLDFQMGVSLQRYLGSLKIPVIALDETGKVIAINQEAKKTGVPETSVASWGNKVYECSHARLPKGCKTAIHCSGCAIRAIVEQVYKSGTSQREIPAHLDHCSKDSRSKADLLISADKIEGIVYLRLSLQR